MDLCDFIYENPVEACDKLLAMYNERGEIIKALKAKLSEFQEGIPIEKANKNKRYLTFDIYGAPRICSFIDLCWQYDVGDMIVPFDSDHRLYPLPSQNSQTQEGS